MAKMALFRIKHFSRQDISDQGTAGVMFVGCLIILERSLLGF